MPRDGTEDSKLLQMCSEDPLTVLELETLGKRYCLLYMKDEPKYAFGCIYIYHDTTKDMTEIQIQAWGPSTYCSPSLLGM